MKSFLFPFIIAAMGAALITASACAPPNSKATIHAPNQKSVDPTDVTAAAKTCLSTLSRNGEKHRRSVMGFVTCEIPLPEKVPGLTPDQPAASSDSSASDSGALFAASPGVIVSSVVVAAAPNRSNLPYRWVESFSSYWIKSQNGALYLNMNLALDTSALPSLDTSALPKGFSIQPLELAQALSEQCTSICTGLKCGSSARLNNKWQDTGLRLAISYLIGGKIAVSGFGPNLSGPPLDSQTAVGAPSTSGLADRSSMTPRPGGRLNAPPAKASLPTPAPSSGDANANNPNGDVTSDQHGAVATADQTLSFVLAPNSTPHEGGVVIVNWPDRGVFYPGGRDIDNQRCGEEHFNKCKIAARRLANEQFCEAFANKIDEWAGQDNPDNSACADQLKPTVSEADGNSLVSTVAQAMHISGLSGDFLANDSTLAVASGSDSRSAGAQVRGLQAGRHTLAESRTSETSLQRLQDLTAATSDGEVQTFWTQRFTADDLVPTLKPLCENIGAAQQAKKQRDNKAAADKAAKEGKPVPPIAPVVDAPNANDPMRSR